MIANELKTIAQRLREYVGNPHHVDPLSEAFKSLIAEAASALSDAAQSELAALREELDSAKSYAGECLTLQSDAQQRLAAAEQRNSVMTECLERLRGCSQLRPAPSLIELIDSALKHTESGASE